MGKALQPGKYVNTDTGELHDINVKMVEVEDGSVVITPNQQESHQKYNNRRKAYNEVYNEFGEFLFIKIKDEMTKLQTIEMPDSYLPRILFLSTFADEDGLLRENGIPVDSKRIIDLLNTTRQTFYKMFHVLEENGVMEKVNTHNFKMSKEYIVKGKLPTVGKNEFHVKMFINTIREIYSGLSMSEKSHQKAFVMALHLLPFMNQNQLVLTYKDGTPILVKDLLDMLGLDPRKYWRQVNYIRNLKLSNGEQVIKFVADGFSKKDALSARMILNPAVFYTGKPENQIEKVKEFELIECL